MLKDGKTNWDTFEKSIPREFAIGYEGKVYKTYFGMPSDTCIDIKRGIKTGIINRKTFIVVVDNNSNYCRKIRRFLKRNFDNFYVFCGDVKDMPLTTILKGKKIDIAFFDLCGNLKYNIQKWLYDNRKCFVVNCRFGLTIAASTRRKEFEKNVYKAVEDTEYIDKLERLLADSKNNLARNIIGEAIEVKKGRGKVKKDGAARAVNVIKSIKIGCYSFMSALCNRKMYIKRLYRYKNGKYNK